MAIQKQEFYEGAALHLLIRGSSAAHVAYQAPFFILDEKLQIHLKYSTLKRSPWGFTFMPDEQLTIRESAKGMLLVLGLVCGSDGVAALTYDAFVNIAGLRDSALRISCRRKHREHFEISGPDGVVPGKVPPSDWNRLLMNI